MAMEEAVGPKSLPTSSQLVKKLSKVYESNLENDREMLESLRALSSSYDNNTLQNRRMLRQQLENEGVALNSQLVDVLMDMTHQIDDVANEIAGMRDAVEDMHSRLQSVMGRTRSLIENTSAMHTRGHTIKMQYEVASAFSQRFSLSTQEELAICSSTEQKLMPGFFQALERCKQIHHDCHSLLRVASAATIGIEIMELMAQKIELAYERLYRWTLNQCHGLTSENAEVSNTLTEAFKALQSRPTMFLASFEELSTARRMSMLCSFLDALTKGEDGRPIELHSYEPVRYTNDMLAWLHQATASENDFIQSLLSNATSDYSVSSTDDVSSKELVRVHEILDRITEGVCRPFRIRVEQLLLKQSGPSNSADGGEGGGSGSGSAGSETSMGPVSLHQLTNLLNFYYHRLSQMLGRNAQLSVTLDELHELCMKMFLNCLNHRATMVLEKIEYPTEEKLMAPGALIDCLQLLRQVLLAHEKADFLATATTSTKSPTKEKITNATNSSSSNGSKRSTDSQQIIDTVLEPLINSCHLCASNLQDPLCADVFLLNCLSNVDNTIALFETPTVLGDQRKRQQIKAEMENHIDLLVEAQAGLVISDCQLQTCYEHALAGSSAETPAVSTLSSADVDQLRTAARLFDRFLAHPDTILLPEISKVSSANLRSTIQLRSNQMLCVCYEQIYRCAQRTSLSNAQFDYKAVLPRDPDQVRQLLL